MDRDGNLALQQVTYGPLKELLQGFLTCKERGNLFTRGIGFNVPILTGRGCKFVHPAQPNGRPTLTRVLPPVGGRPMVTILLFPSVTELPSNNQTEYFTSVVDRARLFSVMVPKPDNQIADEVIIDKDKDEMVEVKQARE